MTPFFRASGFGNSAVEHYAQKVQGYRFETTENMKRGTIAEDILISGADAVKPKWIIKPAVLKGTGFTRWEQWFEANGIDPKADNIIGQDAWDDAIGASDCLRNACINLGMDLANAEKQKQVTLELNVIGRIDGYDTNTVTGTCDYVDSKHIVDFKVFSNEPTKEFLDKYDWQMSIYSYALDLPARLLFAIKKGDKWVASIVHPTIIPQSILSQHANLVVSEFLSLMALNKPTSF